MDDPGSRALEYGQRAADDPATRVTQDRVTSEGALAYASINADGEESPGGGGSSAALPLPWPPVLDARLTAVPKSHLLQTALDVVAAGTAKRKNIAFAIVDLTEAGTRSYVGAHDKEQRFIASTGKLAILFAAFQLRKSVREAAALITDKAIKTDLQLFAAILRPWRREIARFFKGGEGSQNSLPSLAEIFTATPRPAGGWQVEFADTPRGGTGIAFTDRLRSAVKDSDDPNAGKCISLLGFPYIHGCMVKAGFWARGKGLWLSLNYWGLFWWKDAVKEFGTAQGSTAHVLAQVLTLLEFDELVPGNRTEMIELLAGARAGRTVPALSFVTQGLLGYLPEAERGTLDVRSKVGFIDKPATSCDAAIVRHDSAGTALRYVVVILNAEDDEVARDAARALDIAIATLHKPPSPP